MQIFFIAHTQTQDRIENIYKVEFTEVCMKDLCWLLSTSFLLVKQLNFMKPLDVFKFWTWSVILSKFSVMLTLG